MALYIISAFQQKIIRLAKTLKRKRERGRERKREYSLRHKVITVSRLGYDTDLELPHRKFKTVMINMLRSI